MTTQNKSIERRHANARMSQVVATADTVYLAGQVASGDARGTPSTRVALGQHNRTVAQNGPPRRHGLRQVGQLRR